MLKRETRPANWRATAEERKQVDWRRQGHRRRAHETRSRKNRRRECRVLKADTQGSSEAIVESLKEIKSDKVSLKTSPGDRNKRVGHVCVQGLRGPCASVGFGVGCETVSSKLARTAGAISTSASSTN
jgi:translation initiation factor IF-2